MDILRLCVNSRQATPWVSNSRPSGSCSWRRGSFNNGCGWRCLKSSGRITVLSAPVLILNFTSFDMTETMTFHAPCVSANTLYLSGRFERLWEIRVRLKSRRKLLVAISDDEPVSVELLLEWLVLSLHREHVKRCGKLFNWLTLPLLLRDQRWRSATIQSTHRKLPKQSWASLLLLQTTETCWICPQPGPPRYEEKCLPGTRVAPCVGLKWYGISGTASSILAIRLKAWARMVRVAGWWTTPSPKSWIQSRWSLPSFNVVVLAEEGYVDARFWHHVSCRSPRCSNQSATYQVQECFIARPLRSPSMMMVMAVQYPSHNYGRTSCRLLEFCVPARYLVWTALGNEETYNYA